MLLIDLNANCSQHINVGDVQVTANVVDEKYEIVGVYVDSDVPGFKRASHYHKRGVSFQLIPDVRCVVREIQHGRHGAVVSLGFDAPESISIRGEWMEG